MCAGNRDLQKARVRFPATGSIAGPVREEIGESWRRCLTSGVQPDQLDVPYDPDRDTGGRLESAARPVLDQLADDLADSAYLAARFPHDPPSYRRAIDLLTTADFDRLEFILKSQVQEAVVVPFRSPGDWLIAPRINQSFFSCRSDIWTIVRPGARRILPTAPPYPAVSTTSMVKALREVGYERTPGGKGSHIKLAGDDLPPLILPGGRKDLSPIVLRNIAKALGDRNPKELADELG